MKLDKIKNTYNDYKLELSWGQLEVVKAALEQNHADPVADELFAEFSWYMDRIPGPGEEEEDTKAREAGAPEGQPVPGAEGEEDYPIPMPPGEGAPGAEEGAAGGAGLPPEGGKRNVPVPPKSSALPEPGPEEEGPAETEALPAPPRE